METFTGQYGFVLELDSGTKNLAANLSKQYSDNLTPINQRIPHLTLFHTSIKNAPASEIQNILFNIETDVTKILTFDKIVSFGGHFVFWQCDKTKELYVLHEKSLLLAKYFSPRIDVKKENLVLPKEQKDNIAQFGHPLVCGQWDPHITLAYLDRGPKIVSHECQHIASPAAVNFVKIGLYGSVQEVILRSTEKT
jgi:2'-5' RNA ligase